MLARPVTLAFDQSFMVFYLSGACSVSKTRGARSRAGEKTQLDDALGLL